jgi:NitT/TauT family transport system permease protein
MALFYGLLSLARYWAAPLNTQTVIDLSPRALPVYALFSVARIAVAYLLSLAVSLVYGYVAANNPGPRGS